MEACQLIKERRSEGSGDPDSEFVIGFKEALFSTDRRWQVGQKDEVHLIFSPLATNDLFVDLVLDRQYDAQDRLRLLVQCLTRLKWLQSIGIAHCDIKPQNLAVDHQQIAFVIDLGQAQDMSITKGRQIRPKTCGAIGYLAPEVENQDYTSLRDSQGWPAFDYAADVFAIGLVMLELLPQIHVARPIISNDTKNTWLPGRSQAAKAPLSKRSML